MIFLMICVNNFILFFLFICLFYFIFLVINSVLNIFIQARSKCVFYAKEAFYRLYLWDIILSYFFQLDCNLIRLEPEYNSKNFNNLNIAQIVDSVALYNFYGNAKNRNELDDLPLFFMEASNEPMSTEMCHKDELKIAIQMTAALLKLISVCRTAGKEFLANRKIYGLLIGSTDIEVCVAFPVFDDVPEISWGPDIRSHLIILFQNSHKHWRQNLFLSENIANELNSNVQKNCVKGNSCFMKDRSQSSVADFINNQSAIIENLVNAPLSTLRKQSLKLINDDYEFGNSQNAEEFRTTTVSQMKADVNWNCLSIIKYVSDEVKKQASELKEAFPSDNFESFDDSFKFDFEQISTMGPSKSKSSASTRTPNSKKLSKMARFESKSSENSPSRRKKRFVSAEKEPEFDLGLLDNVPEPNRIKTTVERSVDASGVNILNVKKRYSPYEIEIYKNNLIASSHFFPKLFKFEIQQSDQQKIIVLTLERIQSVEFYFKKFLYPDEGHDRNFFASILSKFLLDLFGAVRTLNRAGYVHSDISLNNIGFNESKGVWQLFDFDSSLPIKESLETERECGTSGFISRYAEKSGIFTTIDDFISVLKCWKFICEEWIGGRYFESDFESIISCLSDVNSENQKFNDDQFYLDTFNLYCKFSNFSSNTDSDTSNVADISYHIAKNICREIILIKSKST